MDICSLRHCSTVRTVSCPVDISLSDLAPLDDVSLFGDPNLWSVPESKSVSYSWCFACMKLKLTACRSFVGHSSAFLMGDSLDTVSTLTHAHHSALLH